MAAAIYFKYENNWVAAIEVYKKVNDSWVKQTSLSSVIENDTVYIPRNYLSYLVTENRSAITFGGDKILV